MAARLRTRWRSISSKLDGELSAELAADGDDRMQLAPLPGSALDALLARCACPWRTWLASRASRSPPAACRGPGRGPQRRSLRSADGTLAVPLPPDDAHTRRSGVAAAALCSRSSAASAASFTCPEEDDASEDGCEDAAPHAKPPRYASLRQFVGATEIYRGAASTIYTATCDATRAKVVLKVYAKRRLLASAAQQHGLSRELSLLRRLRGPYVVRLLGSFETDKEARSRLNAIFFRARARGRLSALQRTAALRMSPHALTSGPPPSSACHRRSSWCWSTAAAATCTRPWSRAAGWRTSSGRASRSSRPCCGCWRRCTA